MAPASSTGTLQANSERAAEKSELFLPPSSPPLSGIGACRSMYALAFGGRPILFLPFLVYQKEKKVSSQVVREWIRLRPGRAGADQYR
jgi:hypothetical protein